MDLDLDMIAAKLESFEETIIHRLIDRAQFRHNAAIYRADESGFSGESGKSLFDIRLAAQERMDAEFGRFCVPEERPFTAPLPQPRRPVDLPDTGLAIDDFNHINISADIRNQYTLLVPLISAEGDDGHYGSSVEHDAYALQALGRRIHFGALYVGESKYRQDPSGYRHLADAGNTADLLERLTRREVEEKIISRVGEKVAYIQEKVNRKVRTYIEPGIIMQFYRDSIIPLTKKGEILYLLNRRRTS